MGFGKKKKKTTVTTESKTVIQHKIIKLTYLQSLAVNGGIGELSDLAGQTEASKEVFNSGTSKDNDKKTRLLSYIPIIGLQFGGAKSLFGKKIDINTKVTVDDSGWRVVKTWLQPEFDKIRYAIGIRELLVAQFRYEAVSEVVSTPWTSPKDISKVTLIVDEFIPPQFPIGGTFIEYYIKPELPDIEWIRINPVGSRTVFTQGGTIVPRIISFNTERPANARLESSYVETKDEVRQIRFRAVLKRPDSITGDIPADSYSPILKSYRMLLTPRGGL